MISLKKSLRAASAVAATALLFATPGLSEPLKVGFIYVGPISDFGWTYEHDQGRLAVESALGDSVETTY
ncbi:MAG: BMP family ABC transporter substrate-binding protein, partial [Albidovulum sp.]|nr:BMP family ABC transporter substrate-binding protein [Albidovulum sp.]